MPPSHKWRCLITNTEQSLVPCLVAYLSVLIAFLMSLKWRNIKPCHVSPPQVGQLVRMSQKSCLCFQNQCKWTSYWNLFLLVGFVNHRAVPDRPVPRCIPLTRRKTLCGSSQERTCLCSWGAGDINSMQQQQFPSPVSNTTMQCYQSHCCLLWDTHKLDTEEGAEVWCEYGISHLSPDVGNSCCWSPLYLFYLRCVGEWQCRAERC